MERAIEKSPGWALPYNRDFSSGAGTKVVIFTNFDASRNTFSRWTEQWHSR
jgi:hypothetical protein